MPDSEPHALSICRGVTDDEIAHYKLNGWVKLRAFLDPAVVAQLLERGRSLLGEDADAHSVGPDFQFFNPQLGNGVSDPMLRPMIAHIGSAVRPLMRRGPDIGLRYFNDVFTPKLPSKRQGTVSGAGKTKFHQDYITWGLDRSGGMTVWIALDDLTPVAGTMAFLNGSHRAGVLGDYAHYGDKDVLDIFPDLREDYTISDPMTYAVGDVTVHDNMTVHGGGANLTDKPRWAYIITMNPSDALWTGAPTPSFDWTGMKVHQPLDDEHFPILG